MRHALSLLLIAPPLAAQAPALVIDGPEPGAQFGASVDGAGDVDGDGLADLLVGAPLDQSAGASAFAGSVRVLRGTDGAPLLTAYGDGAFALFGDEVAGVGDIDGDGRGDVAGSEAGTPDGRVRILSGVGGATLADVSGGPLDQLGWDLSHVGDVDGDGVPDLLAGAPGWDASLAGNEGRALVISGASGEIKISFPGAQPGGAAGRAVSGAGDLDGDGTPDVLIGAPLDDTAGANAGRAWAVSGRTGAVLWSRNGTAAGDRFGGAVSGGADSNGDGTPDIVVGAYGVDVMGPESGAMTSYSGAGGGVLSTVNGTQAGSLLGTAVTIGGDRNADGRADPAAGANGFSGAAGRTQTVSGMQGFPLLHTVGAAPGSYHGAALVGVGDTDGDGTADLLVGAFGHGGGRGRIELYRGQAGDFLGSPQVVSIATGGTQDLYLDPGPVHAGQTYWVIGSQSGTAPGIDLLGVHIPLNVDGYLLYAADCPNCPPFQGNLQTIRSDGTGRARLLIPGGVLGPGQVGASFHHAYLLVGGALFSYASGPVPLVLTN